MSLCSSDVQRSAAVSLRAIDLRARLKKRSDDFGFAHLSSDVERRDVVELRGVDARTAKEEQLDELKVAATRRDQQQRRTAVARQRLPSCVFRARGNALYYI
jgi:hypothetical protein